MPAFLAIALIKSLLVTVSPSSFTIDDLKTFILYHVNFFVKENSSLPFLQSRQRRDNLLPGLGGDCQGNYTGIAEKKLSG
jgi:hypothetical protein